MPSGDSISHAFLLSTMWPAVMAQVTIPYIPTHAFSPSQGSNGSGLVYVLQPRSDQSTVQLLSLNLSTTINPSSPQYTVLYDDVPFSTNSEAYVPMPDSNGSITVFTGNCQASQSAAPRLWSFQPDQNSLMGNGTWSSVAANGSGTNVTGPGYLASGFAFNSSNDTSSEFYTFGGMCPFAGGDQSDWTLNANYSNTMTALTAANTSSSNYIVQQTESSNSPIAEAGYTVTPLQKTSSTTSGGRVVQQGNFLFIGGHTETAFLNMSTLALFSLPQASWSYISIGANVGTGRTDLAIRATTQIEPRSGHSAVMSSDGSKIIVFGGWVGDTSTPADPQLAILEVGDDYGGSGPWTWSIPAPTGSGPGSGSGIFGHATTMLAEDVMMISGGYIIPASSGATSKRDSSSAGFASSSQVYLYNLTSNSWMPSYTAPIPSNTNTSSHSSGALSSPGEKAGLGVGVSAAVIAIICIGYFYWSRKRWSHRRQRDQQLRKLALGAERSNIWAEPGVESSYRGPGDSALRNSILENVYFSGSSHQYSAVPAPDNNNSNKTEGEGSGLLDDVPSPSKARRSLSSRPQRVQSAGRYEDSRTGYGSGSIHPIDERDEFETPPEEASGGRPESGSSGSSSNNNRFSDPFTDQSPSPTRGHLVAFHEKSIRRQEGTDGVSIRSGQSRSASPDKSERTHSDLSESSRSGISELSIQMSNHGSQRRSTHLFQSPIPTLEPSNHDDSGSGRTSPEKSSLLAGRPDIDSSGMRWPFERSGTVDSFSTSASHHRRSPVEGDTLLGSGPEWSTPPESPSRLSYRENRSNHNSNSPTWMGSIRKTLSNARKVVLSGYGNSSFAEEHRVSPAMIEITSPVDFDDDDNLSPQISRRASSASVVAHHQRRKQGPRDWAVDRSSRHSGMSLSTSSPRRSRRTNEFDDNDEDDAFNDNLDVEDPDDQGGSSIGDDDDWDVELAAEGRLVQITYTVPKERLRVVNAGAGDRVIGDDASEVVSRTSQEGK